MFSTCLQIRRRFDVEMPQSALLAVARRLHLRVELLHGITVRYEARKMARNSRVSARSDGGSQTYLCVALQKIRTRAGKCFPLAFRRPDIRGARFLRARPRIPAH